MTVQAQPAAAPKGDLEFAERRRLADRVFRGALLFNACLTIFWIVVMATGRGAMFYTSYQPSLEGIAEILGFVIFFYLGWGFVWYGIKALLLRRFVGMTADDVGAAFSSRMDRPFDVSALVARYSERRIRIVDMIGRRGRFITLAALGFVFLYVNLSREPSPSRALLGFTSDNLFSAVFIAWAFLGMYYANGAMAAATYGPQSRIMDGVLGRANNLLITTLWSAFAFVMVPLAGPFARLFQPAEFAPLFAFIWGSYIACDTMAEVGGSIFGRQRIRVIGVGDVNRKSIAGAACGFVAALLLCLTVVYANSLPPEWIVLAVVIALSNTMLELWSPRGTDDFTMATGNALLCLAFGVLRA